MGEKIVASWKDLMLLQLGALLRNCAANRNRRLYKEWFLLVDPIVRMDASFRGKKRDETGHNCKVTSVQALLTYFFTYAAAVHQRFLDPERELDLKELVSEYHLDLLAENPCRKRDDFESNFGGVIPRKGPAVGTLALEPSQVGDGLEGVKWRTRTKAERAEACWERILCYLEESGAPTHSTSAGTAFTWLEEKNRGAYREFVNAYGERLFDYRCECEMGETYQRFLRRMDDWDPVFLKLWAAFQRNAQRRLRELSAVLGMMPEAVPDQGGERDV